MKGGEWKSEVRGKWESPSWGAGTLFLEVGTTEKDFYKFATNDGIHMLSGTLIRAWVN